MIARQERWPVDDACELIVQLRDAVERALADRLSATRVRKATASLVAPLRSQARAAAKSAVIALAHWEAMCAAATAHAALALIERVDDELWGDVDHAVVESRLAGLRVRADELPGCALAIRSLPAMQERIELLIVGDRLLRPEFERARSRPPSNARRRRRSVR